MNKVIVGVVVILAIAVTGLFFYGNGGSSTNLSSPPESLDEQPNVEVGTKPQTVSPGTDIEQKDDGTSPNEDTTEAVTITYTDAGFEPKSVTIYIGQTVRFVNQSSRGMWVASASHPTHELYPVKTSIDCLGSAFDTCKSLPSGQSWSFSFDEIGSWGYHNHVQAGHRGSVIVR